MQFKVLGWVLVVASVFFALAGAAPLGGGALFPVISLPMAAVVAWRGPRLTPLLVLTWALIGFWIAVIPRGELFDGWGLIAWLALCSAVLLLGVFRRHDRDARAADVHKASCPPD